MMRLDRILKLELTRYGRDREKIVAIIHEESMATREQAEELAAVMCDLQDGLDEAAELCHTFREKIRELQNG